MLNHICCIYCQGEGVFLCLLLCAIHLHEDLMASKFRSSGQMCVCANRVFVHDSVMEEFERRLVRRLDEVFVYDSVWDRKTNFGPLYSPKGVEKVRRHLEDVRAHDAEVITGGLPEADGNEADGTQWREMKGDFRRDRRERHRNGRQIRSLGRPY